MLGLMQSPNLNSLQQEAEDREKFFETGLMSQRLVTSIIPNRSEWVKVGNSPKTLYIIDNTIEQTVYFHTNRTGKHYQYSVTNFLKKFQLKHQ